MSVPGRFPTLAYSTSVPHHLPHNFYSLTPLLGRESILNELRGQVTDPLTRILTLTGPSGVGKSRLVVALFDQMVEEFADGGRYVDVVANTPDDLLETLAVVVEAPADETRPVFDRIVDHLSTRHFLLVIDSAEHLLDSVALTVVNLAAACAKLTVLVASIEKLGVYGEHVVRLGPLETPAPSLTDLNALARVPSAKLFVHRARAVRSGFRLTRENQQAVAELCRRLDGLPLAIELAAARLQLTAPQDLLDRLDGNSDLLWGTQAHTLSRHLCLQASCEKGWRLLTRDEQSLLCRLAVFAGEFSHADVTAVADSPGGPAPHLLTGLVDKSFLLSTERPAGDVGFRILRTTRDYLLTRGGEGVEMRQTRQRHAAHFLDLAETAHTGFNGPDQERLLSRLRHYQDDLEAAADYLVARRDGARAAALATALVPYWLLVGAPCKAVRRLREALTLDDVPDDLRARLLAGLGESSLLAGDLDGADEHLTAATAGYAEVKDEPGGTITRHLLAVLAHRRGGPEAEATAEGLLIDVVEEYRDLGDPAGQAYAVGDLAVVYLAAGLPEVAQRLATDAMTWLTEVGDRRRAAHVGLVLAGALCAGGDPAAAERQGRESLGLLRELGDRPAVLTGLVIQSAVLTCRHGRITDTWRRAARLAAAVTAMFAEMGVVAPRHLAATLDGLTEEARARLGDEAFVTAWTQGDTLGLEEAVTEALAPVDAPRQPDEVAGGTTLTLREQEVAELVAAGLTNREIGRRLGIAEWTVVNHMRKVMRKLRCSSRVQVARWVTSQQQDQEARTG